MRLCSPHCGVAPETVSGGETYERELLVRLGRAGVLVDIILARHQPLPASIPNWTVHRFGIGRGLRWYVAPFVVPQAIKRVWDATGFDVLRVHSVRYMGPAALWARRRYRLDVPLVAHHHHLDPDPLNRVIERRVIAAADAIVVGSEFARRQLAARLGVRTEHVAVVPYGIDARFAPGPKPSGLLDALTGRPVALFLGGLKPRKNLDRLLEVWARVAAARPAAVLVVAGGGALGPTLRRQAERLGLGSSVRFTGYVPEARKADYFKLADVFVFPSAMEGFGLSVGEAMSSGLPVVASARGSIPELLRDGEGGMLADPDAPDTFVAPLVRLLDDPALRDRMGRANRERVERLFRWDRCVAATAAVYEDVVRERRRRPAVVVGR